MQHPRPHVDLRLLLLAPTLLTLGAAAGPAAAQAYLPVGGFLNRQVSASVTPGLLDPSVEDSRSDDQNTALGPSINAFADNSDIDINPLTGDFFPIGESTSATASDALFGEGSPRVTSPATGEVFDLGIGATADVTFSYELFVQQTTLAGEAISRSSIDYFAEPGVYEYEFNYSRTAGAFASASFAIFQFDEGDPESIAFASDTMLAAGTRQDETITGSFTLEGSGPSFRLSVENIARDSRDRGLFDEAPPSVFSGSALRIRQVPEPTTAATLAAAGLLLSRRSK